MTELQVPLLRGRALPERLPLEKHSYLLPRINLYVASTIIPFDETQYLQD